MHKNIIKKLIKNFITILGTFNSNSFIIVITIINILKIKYILYLFSYLCCKNNIKK